MSNELLLNQHKMAQFSKFQLTVKVPKFEHPKSGKCQNPNECWFGFQHVPILAARALMNKPNLSEIGTFDNWGFGLKPNNFGPNCPKHSNFGQLGIMFQILMFCPIPILDRNIVQNLNDIE